MAAIEVKVPATPVAKAVEVWKVPVGIGHASPVVADGRAYLFTRRNEQETIAAFESRDGQDALVDW